jgi:hypothetical protein
VSFVVVYVFTFCDKFNKLDIDEDTVSRETERSSNDGDFLYDLDEEFHDLSCEDGDSVNQISEIEPMCKKARTVVGTLYKVSDDSEEETSVLRAERHVAVIDSGCEINSGVGDGDRTVNDVDLEHDDTNLDDCGVGDTII